MNQDNPTQSPDDDEMLPEYDFTGKTGVRGTYYQRMRDGYTIRIHQSDGKTIVHQVVRPERSVTLDPDVQAYFPDAESVNTALRALIQLIPNKKSRRKSIRPNTKRARS
jgi:hypothetical protein